MGYYTVLPGSKPEYNDSFLYVENVSEDNQAVTVRDAGENQAELIEIKMIAPKESTIVVTKRSQEVFEIEDDDDDAEVSDNNTNTSTSFSSDVLPINSLTRVPYRCKLCKQIKRGHNCPSKNSSTMADCVLEEPLGGSRKASNRENLSRLAQRVGGDESSDKDSDWTPTRFGKRKRGQAVNCMSTTNEKKDWPPKKMRKLHNCRNCQVLFKGHICPHKHL